MRSPDGRYVYLTAYRSPRIHIIDTQSNNLIGEITADVRASGLAISPDGNRLFLTEDNKDRVTIVDVPTRAVVARILISDAHNLVDRTVTVHPTGRYLCATTELDTVVIDLASNSIVSVAETSINTAWYHLVGRW